VTRRLPPPLLAVSPGDLDARAVDSRRLVRLVGQACEAGLTGLLLREPGLSDGSFLELARELRRILGAGWLGLHDRVHLAAEIGADGVHLGGRSLPVREARAVGGEDLPLGLSTHLGDDPDLLEDADYRFFGPLNSTPSKVGILDPVGLPGLRDACTSCRVPTWALGGVNPEDVGGVMATGAMGVAVLRGVLLAPDPGLATRAYLAAFAAAGPTR